MPTTMQTPMEDYLNPTTEVHEEVILDLARIVGELRREVDEIKAGEPGKMNEAPTRKDG